MADSWQLNIIFFLRWWWSKERFDFPITNLYRILRLIFLFPCGSCGSGVMHKEIWSKLVCTVLALARPTLLASLLRHWDFNFGGQSVSSLGQSVLISPLLVNSGVLADINIKSPSIDGSQACFLLGWPPLPSLWQISVLNFRLWFLDFARWFKLWKDWKPLG